MALHHIKHDNGTQEFIDLPFHYCTENDLAQFHPPDLEGDSMIKTYGDLLNIDLIKSFQCIEENSYKELQMKANNIKKISIFFVPCNKLPWGPYEVGEECITDESE